MTRQQVTSIAAIAISIAFMSAVSTDAFARPGRGAGGVGGPGVGHRGVGVGHRGVGVGYHPVARGAAVGVAVGTAAVVAAPGCAQMVDAYGRIHTGCY